MGNNIVIARRASIAGFVGIALGVVAGQVGLFEPDSVYGSGSEAYIYSTQPGKIVAWLNGVMVLCFAAAFIGYHLVGAVGNGRLGKVATILSAVGNIGVAIAFFHGALSGEESPLNGFGFLILPGWILLTVAALRVKRVSTLHAFWPLGTLIVLSVIEFAIPINAMTAIAHQVVYGSISFVVWANLKVAPLPMALRTA